MVFLYHQLQSIFVCEFLTCRVLGQPSSTVWGVFVAKPAQPETHRSEAPSFPVAQKNGLDIHHTRLIRHLLLQDQRIQATGEPQNWVNWNKLQYIFGLKLMDAILCIPHATIPSGKRQAKWTAQRAVTNRWVIISFQTMAPLPWDIPSATNWHDIRYSTSVLSQQRECSSEGASS